MAEDEDEVETRVDGAESESGDDRERDETRDPDDPDRSDEERPTVPTDTLTDVSWPDDPADAGDGRTDETPGEAATSESSPAPEVDEDERSPREEGADVPFADLLEADEESVGSSALDELAEEAFEAVDIEEIDAATLWRQVEGEALAERPTEGPSQRVVPKREYCHRCEFFSSPPTMACTHEGTTIVELVDVDHVLVEDCPIVYEREATRGSDPT